MGQPLFIVLDGLDGTGKSTQCRLLADWLREQGREVVSCVDPGGTALGNELRTILLQQRRDVAPLSEALLFMAARAQLIAEVIRPALAAGHCVVCDRFLLSTIVYQGHAGGLDCESLWQAGRIATGGLEPDLTVVLDLPSAVAATRRSRPADRIEARGDDYHARVRTGFLAEVSRQPDRLCVVDASGTIGEVAQAIRKVVAEFVKSREFTVATGAAR